MRLSKNPFGLFRQVLQSAARIICLSLADKFRTCSLRCVFVHVHAAAENVSILFAAFAASSARLFDSLSPPKGWAFICYSG